MHAMAFQTKIIVQSRLFLIDSSWFVKVLAKIINPVVEKSPFKSRKLGLMGFLTPESFLTCCIRSGFIGLQTSGILVCRLQYKICAQPPQAPESGKSRRTSKRRSSTAPVAQHPFMTLPRELQLKIICKLGPHDLISSLAPVNWYMFDLVQNCGCWKSVHLATFTMTTPTTWAVLEVLHQICNASKMKEGSTKSISGISLRNLSLYYCALPADEVFQSLAFSCQNLQSLTLSFKGRQSVKVAGYKLKVLSKHCPKLSRLVFEKVTLSLMLLP
jgi:hypothetical protein